MRWLKPRPWIISASKLAFGTYFILTSLYCLLAFIPYTYFFLIKAPPSEALIVFTHYHSLLYWIALAAGVIGYWEHRKHSAAWAAWFALGGMGIVFTAKNYLPHVQNNWTAYACSVGILLPVVLLAALDGVRGPTTEAGNTGPSLLSYSNGIIVALI